MSSKAAPYGTWSSPITPDAILRDSVRFTDILVDPITSAIYHIEGRPSENGRSVLVNTVTKIDVVGKDWNVRTGVQEYGGAPAIVCNGIIYFSHFKDGRVYRTKEGGDPEAVTPESTVYRFAGFAVHPIHTHLLVSILEDHTIDTPAQVVTTLVVINTETKTISPLVDGADFYAGPKFSPDGTRLTWTQWFHPDMPWEGSQIYIADVFFEAGALSVKNMTPIAGERSKVSCGYPSWASNDTLIFTSDESDYINPWRYTHGKAAEALFSTPVDLEFGAPFWQLHMFPYAIVGEESQLALFTAVKDGRDALYVVDLISNSQPRLLDTPYVVIDNLRCVSRRDQVVVFVGGKVNEGPSIVQCSLSDLGGASSPTFTVLKSALSLPFPKEIISVPQPMTLKASSGDPIHVVFYAPQNPNYSGSDNSGELPPCVVNAHGGPTSLSKQGLSWIIQRFTSRGWAWLDVNYGGSSGYGRQYMNRLVGKWGIVDTQDCIEASRLLSSGPNAMIDPKRIAIRGGSAGGYTTLAAIALGPDLTTFAAATSIYGISDLQPMVEETHKFESQYMFKLMGGTVEEVPAVYKERSPLHHADNIVSPLLILQGEIDRVVPKEQAELIYNSLKARNGIVEYQLYPGEGHGWGQENTIRDALERELRFYEKIFGLQK